MLKFIKAFLIFIILYHILVTLVCYGFFSGQYQEVFSLIRDGIWLAFVVVVMIRQRNHCKAFLKTRRYPFIVFGFLLLFGIGISQRQGKSWYDIFVGIKYGVWYLVILLSSTYIGYVLAYKKHDDTLKIFLRYAVYALIIVVAVGFFWQFGKLVLPNFFHRIGYGPLNDFYFGSKPPMYYLTGLGGTLRWQGIFAGPNNYGYFLVAFLPLIVNLVKLKTEGTAPTFTKLTKFTKLTMGILRILAIALTLSRSAIIGTIVVLAFIFRSWIKKHRKITIGILVLCLLGLVGLSLLKDTSTLAHIAKKFSSLSYVINQPLGYGFGTSGPAIHHNGSMLPENYFIQLMIDIGTIGFLIWAFCVSQIGVITREIKRVAGRGSGDGDFIYAIWKGLTIGWIALLVMGMFLHVFEDSMVNYSFFILWGITTGYLSYGLKGVKIGLRDFWKKSTNN